MTRRRHRYSLAATVTVRTIRLVDQIGRLEPQGNIRVTSYPLNLVGSFDDPPDRMVVQVEIDRRTGEVLSVSGDRDAIRRTCAFLLESIEPQELQIADDGGDRVSPRRLSDQEARAKARPANMLAALRRERERTADTSAGVRTETDQCELVSRRDADRDDHSEHREHGEAFDAFPPRSPGEGLLARRFLGDPGEDVGLELVPGDSPVGGDSAGSPGTADAWGSTDVGDHAGTVGMAVADQATADGCDESASNRFRGAGRDRSGTGGRSRRTFVTGRGGSLRLVPQAVHAPTTNAGNPDEERSGS